VSEKATPSPDQLVARAKELVPLIASKAQWSEENRRINDDVSDALAEAGMFSLRVPTRYGGSAASAHTMVDVLSTLALGDGSTAWNTAVWAIGSWLASTFPDHVQDEVFAKPSTRICVVLSPTAQATEVDGGLRVSGRWHFMSGALHSDWQVIIAMAPAPDGTQWPIAGLVPMSELKIVDEWHASGLAATGSVTTLADDVFVPAERVLPMAAILQGQYASKLNAGSPVFDTPMIPNGAIGFVSVALGMAKSARHEFLKWLPGRRIAYTDYETQSAAPITHLQVAEATLKIDEAEFHARGMADRLDLKGASGEQWKLDDRVRNRGSLGRATQLAKEAVEVLSIASGGASIHRTVPIQRIQRDVHAFNMHALMHPNTNFELYGRVLCGLEPNTMYL